MKSLYKKSFLKLEIGIIVMHFGAKFEELISRFLKVMLLTQR